MEWDFDRKRIRVYEYKYVVDEIDPEGPKGQITLEDAQEIKPKAKVGSEIKTEIHLNSFSRKAASIFKQSLLSGLKELERENAYNYFKDKVGEVITAKVIDYSNNFVTFNVGKNCYAHMPDKESIPGEKFFPGDEKKSTLPKSKRQPRARKFSLPEPTVKSSKDCSKWKFRKSRTVRLKLWALRGTPVPDLRSAFSLWRTTLIRKAHASAPEARESEESTKC